MFSLSFGDGFGVLLGEVAVALMCFMFQYVSELEGIAAGSIAKFAKFREVAGPPPLCIRTLFTYWYLVVDSILESFAKVLNHSVELLLLHDDDGWGNGIELLL